MVKKTLLLLEKVLQRGAELEGDYKSMPRDEAGGGTSLLSLCVALQSSRIDLAMVQFHAPSTLQVT